eukprot:875237-Rhodomonas_salina.1
MGVTQQRGPDARTTHKQGRRHRARLGHARGAHLDIVVRRVAADVRHDLRVACVAPLLSSSHPVSASAFGIERKQRREKKAMEGCCLVLGDGQRERGVCHGVGHVHKCDLTAPWCQSPQNSDESAANRAQT